VSQEGRRGPCPGILETRQGDPWLPQPSFFGHPPSLSASCCELPFQTFKLAHPFPRSRVWMIKPRIHQLERCRTARVGPHAACRKGPVDSTAIRRLVLARVAFPATHTLPMSTGGATMGVAERSSRTCMRSSRERPRLASVIAPLLGRPGTFLPAQQCGVSSLLSAWHSGSKGTLRSAGGGKICETRSVGMEPGQRCLVFVFLCPLLLFYALPPPSSPFPTTTEYIGAG